MSRPSPDAVNQHRAEIREIKASLTEESKSSPILTRVLMPVISILNRYDASSPQDAIATLCVLDTAKSSLEKERSALISESNRKTGDTSKIPTPALNGLMRKVRSLLSDAWLKIMLHFGQRIKYDTKTDTYSTI